MNDITVALAGLTERLIRYRKHVEMSRLTDKLTQAAGVALRQSTKIEARADALIEREAAIERRTNEAFAPHESILSEAEKGLDEVEKQLNLLSNNPLASSTSSQDAPQTTQHPPGLTRGGVDLKQ